MFYFYEFTKIKNFEWKDSFHFIPFLSFFLILIPIWINGAESIYGKFLYENSILITRILWFLVVLQYGFYWWKLIHLINKHTSEVETEYSTIEGKTLSWLKRFLHLFGLFFFVITVILIIILHTDNYFFIDKTICLALSITIFVLGYYGIFQDDVFSIINPVIIQTSLKIPKESEVTEKTLDIKNKNEVKRILDYLINNKPFLNPDLTLTALAGQLDITRNQLSSIINNELNNSFYDFINRYRVEEVKQLIADPKNKNYTILALAFEAGFSSKSAFNDIFKKFTGITPSKYRDNQH